MWKFPQPYLATMFTNNSVKRNELMLATHTRSCIIWYANVHQTLISPSRLTQFQVEETLFIFNLKPVDQNEKDSQNLPTQREPSRSAVSPGEMLWELGSVCRVGVPLPQTSELPFHCRNSQQWAGSGLCLCWEEKKSARMIFFMVFQYIPFWWKLASIHFGPQWCHLSNYYSSELNHAPVDRKVNLFPRRPTSNQEATYLHCRSWLCVIMLPQQLGS